MFLIDISMPVMDGVMATKELCKRHPGAKVIALSVFGQESQIMEMLDFHLRIMKVIKILEFHVRIMQLMKIIKNPRDN